MSWSARFPAPARCADRVQLRWWRLLGAGAVGLLLLMLSCDPYLARPNSTAGVLRTNDGAIEIVKSLCADERVQMVELVDTTGPGAIGDPANKVLWRIASPDGRPRTRFTVGVTPVGFAQQVPLASGELPADLGILVRSSRLEAIAAFRFDDLRLSEIWSYNKLVASSEFWAGGRRFCSG